jgi:hypothetical protein
MQSISSTIMTIELYCNVAYFLFRYFPGTLYSYNDPSIHTYQIYHPYYCILPVVITSIDHTAVFRNLFLSILGNYWEVFVSFHQNPCPSRTGIQHPCPAYNIFRPFDLYPESVPCTVYPVDFHYITLPGFISLTHNHLVNGYQVFVSDTFFDR